MMRASTCNSTISRESFAVEALTTAQVADLCGVDRTTVGYWVRTGKIQARRAGKSYQIQVSDLRLFLESSGLSIPEELGRQNHQRLDFPTVQPCWDYFTATHEQGRCETCVVYMNKVEPCFTCREIGAGCCAVNCASCEYYRKFYHSRIRFVHQIQSPAAVYKGLYIWGGNDAYESLLGFAMGQSIGAGIERVVHGDNMEMIISFAKRRALGDPCIPKYYQAEVKTKDKGKIAVQVLVTSLNEPAGTFLAIFDPLEVKP
jgi:excisionase family DNA binding protein